MSARICLNMIVKNETANLPRCLASVAEHISCWVIGDTGSTDGTPAFIEKFFADRGIPGELHHFPFRNFQQARNDALDRARTSKLDFDYILLIDADMELVASNGDFIFDLSHSAYFVRQDSGVSYWNIRLLNRHSQSRYRGVTHEFLDVNRAETQKLLQIYFTDHATGTNRVGKYERDAELLKQAISEEQDVGMLSRYTFYLANTLRDAGKKQEAISYYRQRVEMGGWEQEIYVSLLNIGQLQEQLGYPQRDVLDAYDLASSACPTRAEALHNAARYCRINKEYSRAYYYAVSGLAIPKPSDALFLYDWIYDYGLIDELAVSSFWIGQHKICADACHQLLSAGFLPTSERDRVAKNKTLAEDNLKNSASRPCSVGKVPKVIHFITGLDENFGGKPFSFVHYMAIRSALEVNKGFAVNVYFHYEPQSPYWDLIKPHVNTLKVELPNEVFGNPVEHFAHKADVLRMRILLATGGIYLDLDTICQRSFQPLLDGRVVLGREERADINGTRKCVGLCNATIIAPPGAEFIRLWYDSYRTFVGGTSGDDWNRHSVQIPMELAARHPNLVRMEPADSFFWPSWDVSGIESLFVEDNEYPDAYSFHLWESKSWQHLCDLNFESVTTSDTTYNRVARRFLSSAPFSLPPSNSPEFAGKVDLHYKSSQDEDIRKTFSQIYENNDWGGGSGSGSKYANNIEYAAFVARFMDRNKIRSVVDLGCGDWQFSQFINWQNVHYTGVDAAAAVIERNKRLHGHHNINFEVFSGFESLPSADLLLCKDVMQHWANELVQKALEVFPAKFRYMLLTNDEEPIEKLNIDISTGGWRPIDIRQQPFFFNAATVMSWYVYDGTIVRKSTMLAMGHRVG